MTTIKNGLKVVNSISRSTRRYLPTSNSSSTQRTLPVPTHRPHQRALNIIRPYAENLTRKTPLQTRPFCASILWPVLLSLSYSPAGSPSLSCTRIDRLQQEQQQQLASYNPPVRVWLCVSAACASACMKKRRAWECRYFQTESRRERGKDRTSHIAYYTRFSWDV